MTEPMIGPFRGRHRIYSNFHGSWIQIGPEEYARYPTLRELFAGRPFRAPDVERPYQAGKSDDPAEQDRILAAPTPGAAKRMGRRTRMRAGFEEKKLALMEELVDAKFRQNPALREALLATGEIHMCEVNSWFDTTWGVCNGVGENHLGKTLMRVRARLRAEAEADEEEWEARRRDAEFANTHAEDR